jgi:hypothetical protein
VRKTIVKAKGLGDATRRKKYGAGVPIYFNDIRVIHP